MSEYSAPLKDMTFLLKDVIGIERIGKLPGCEDVTADLVDAIFDEAGKFSATVLAPLNRIGDQYSNLIVLRFFNFGKSVGYD